MANITAKNVQPGDKTWTFLDGSKRTVVVLDSVVIGRGEYLPGWQWSKHVQPISGKESESHIGLVLSGKFGLQGPDGIKVIVGPGDAFEIRRGHDAWVVGDEPCIALDFDHLANSLK